MLQRPLTKGGASLRRLLGILEPGIVPVGLSRDLFSAVSRRSAGRVVIPGTACAAVEPNPGLPGLIRRGAQEAALPAITQFETTAVADSEKTPAPLPASPLVKVNPDRLAPLVR